MVSGVVFCRCYHPLAQEQLGFLAPPLSIPSPSVQALSTQVSGFSIATQCWEAQGLLTTPEALCPIPIIHHVESLRALCLLGDICFWKFIKTLATLKVLK